MQAYICIYTYMCYIEQVLYIMCYGARWGPSVLLFLRADDISLAILAET